MLKKKLYGKTRTVPILKSKLQILSWIVRGRVRKFVFTNIKRRTTPAELVDKLTGREKRRPESHYAQVSRALAELKLQGLIQCLNPNEKIGRFYELTKKGKNAQKEFED